MPILSISKSELQSIITYLRNQKRDRNTADLLAKDGTSLFVQDRWLKIIVPSTERTAYNTSINNRIMDAVQSVMPQFKLTSVTAEVQLPEVAISDPIEDRTGSTGGMPVIPLTPMFQAPSREQEFQCDIFMIMPFVKELEPMYAAVQSVVSGLGLVIKRGDATYSPHAIVHEIWSMLNNCKIAIADCTGKNTNVFYELGIAHALGKPVVIIVQNLSDLPFDVQGLRAIKYVLKEVNTKKDFSNDIKHAVRSLAKKQ